MALLPSDLPDSLMSLLTRFMPLPNLHHSLPPIILPLAQRRQNTRRRPTRSLALALRRLGRIARVRAQHTRWCRARSIVDHLPATHAALGADVVVGLGRFGRVLLHGLRVGRVDHHDHAGLAMLSLRAVDVHWLVVCDGDHERRRVGLAAVVLATLASVSACACAASGARDGLEIAEYGVALGLAGGVCVGRRDAVVLRDEVEGHHVAWLRGDGVGREGEFVVGGDGDGHCGG